MRIAFASDLHYEFHEAVPQLAELRDLNPDIVVLAGDIGPHLLGIEACQDILNAVSVPVIYIAGNHEYYGSEYSAQKDLLRRQASNSSSNGKEIIFLDNETFSFKGVRFVGATLWTDFELLSSIYTHPGSLFHAQRNMSDFKVIKHGKKKLFPEDTVQFHKLAVALIKANLSIPYEGNTVVVTHHAPHQYSLNPDFGVNDELNPAYASDLSELILDHNPNIWIHGHTHHDVDYMIGNTRILSNQLGYPGQKSFSWKVVEV